MGAKSGSLNDELEGNKGQEGIEGDFQVPRLSSWVDSDTVYGDEENWRRNRFRGRRW